MTHIKETIAQASHVRMKVVVQGYHEPGLPEFRINGERLGNVFNITRNSAQCRANAVLMTMGFNHLPSLIRTGEALRSLLEADLKGQEPWQREAQAFLEALTSAQNIEGTVTVA